MTGAHGGAGPKARPGRRWEVGLSSAGAQRDYVELAGEALQAGGRCLYDADEQVELWRKFLPEELAGICGEQMVVVVVVFVSAEYVARDWTRHERRAALARAVRGGRERSTGTPGSPPGI